MKNPRPAGLIVVAILLVLRALLYLALFALTATQGLATGTFGEDTSTNVMMAVCVLVALPTLVVAGGVFMLNQNFGRRLGAVVLLLDLFLAIASTFFGLNCCGGILNGAFDLFALKMLYQDHSQAFEVW